VDHVSSQAALAIAGHHLNYRARSEKSNVCGGFDLGSVSMMSGFRGRLQPSCTPGGSTASAPLVARSESSFTVPVAIPSSPSRLDCVPTLPERLNPAGVSAPQEAGPRGDPEGSSLGGGAVKVPSPGQLPKDSHPPSGGATVARHGAQSPPAGKTSGPLGRPASSSVPPPGSPR
jgi:hypothetical protein